MREFDRIPYTTPFQSLERLGSEIGIELWAKRDDLSPVPGGGTKIRKLSRILTTIKDNTDALVTTGGVHSNHARVVALVSAERGMRCELILHGDANTLQNPTGNLLLMLLSGANVTIVPSDRIRSHLESTMERLRAEGYSPKMIEGGGHSVEGALGLVDAVIELNAQKPSPDWIPDYIIHASGTGGTQAGILAGLDLLGWRTHVIGISVARSAARGAKAVSDLYDKVRAVLELGGQARLVDFRDHWVGGGYGQPLPGIEELIKRVAALEGLPLDPTYTSKAMRGLIDLVDQGDIPKGSKVVFWHTGGLLNLFSGDMKWGFET